MESGFSDTVTVFDVPEGMTADDILERMREKHGIMLAGSFGELAGKVIRIGHMGASANVGRYVRSDVWIGRNIEISWMEIRE